MPDPTRPLCQLCGEPMPTGEEVFNYHGFSGPCPKPPLPVKQQATREELLTKLVAAHRAACTAENCVLDGGEEHQTAFQEAK